MGLSPGDETLSLDLEGLGVLFCPYPTAQVVSRPGPSEQTLCRTVGAGGGCQEPVSTGEEEVGSCHICLFSYPSSNGSSASITLSRCRAIAGPPNRILEIVLHVPFL